MEERDSGGRLPVLIGAAAGVTAFAMIAGLLAYSFYHAFDGGDEVSSPVQAAAAAPRPTPLATLTPDEVAHYASQPIMRYFYVFILCDGETVEGAIYSGIIYSESVTLLATPDHDLIVDIAAGKPTILPADSKVFPSVCARQMFNISAVQ